MESGSIPDEYMIRPAFAKSESQLSQNSQSVYFCKRTGTAVIAGLQQVSATY